MDNTVLKKRLSTFRTDKGILKNVNDELLIDILRSWESWPGTLKDFYGSIGVSPNQMAKLMGRAKKLKREGNYPEEAFKEIKIEGAAGSPGSLGEPCTGIELSWDAGKVIRFSQVEQLVDFLKKVA